MRGLIGVIQKTVDATTMLEDELRWFINRATDPLRPHARASRGTVRVLVRQTPATHTTQ